MIKNTSTQPLLVVCGPTASGKTGLGIDLALEFGGEIISADSMQVYKTMDIGTAKPTHEEKRGVPHHLIDILTPDETFSVAQYAKLARETIADIHTRGKLPILVGGTGLYINGVVDNISYAEVPEDKSLRERLRESARQHGNEAMLNRLRCIDPELSETLHPNNIGRIIRAIEVWELTGEPMSTWQKRSRETPAPYNLCMLGLTFKDRSLLYGRIEKRVDIMLQIGLIDEVKLLQKSGFLDATACTASQAIAYKEFFDYLSGKQSLADAISHLKQQTRRYAKRQLTWFRRDERIHWLYMDNPYDDVLMEARAAINN